MTCELTKRFVPGYLDGELELVRTIEMDKHLQTCGGCARELEIQDALRAAVKSGSLMYATPRRLRERIQSSLRASSAKKVPVIGRARGQWRFFQWAAAFAVLAVCAVTAWHSLGGVRGTSNDQLIAADVFASHVRSLEANHLTDVVSTDQHTVKPWFDGKLDFSPPVKDLASEGFPLMGGRLDYLEGREVAALIYQRREHLINVFVWPNPTGSNPTQAIESRQGYNIMRWSHGGFQCWAVSDVAPSDLAGFVRLLETYNSSESN